MVPPITIVRIPEGGSSKLCLGGGVDRVAALALSERFARALSCVALSPGIRFAPEPLPLPSNDVRENPEWDMTVESRPCQRMSKIMPRVRAESRPPKWIPNPDAAIQPPMFEVFGDDLVQTVVFGVGPEVRIEPGNPICRRA